MAPDQTNQAAPASPVPQATPQTGQQAAAASPASNMVFILPMSVVSRADIGHALRELQRLDEYFHQAAIKGAQARNLPKLGHALEDIAVANKLNLLYEQHRTPLITFLTVVKTKAPVVHMSFPSEASKDFLAKLLEWYRGQIHPLILLHVGLQPELAAGCTVRTTNKMFDFSFRKRFEKSKQKLIAALEASGRSDEVQAQKLTAPVQQPTGAPQ